MEINIKLKDGSVLTHDQLTVLKDYLQGTIGVSVDKLSIRGTEKQQTILTQKEIPSIFRFQDPAQLNDCRWVTENLLERIGGDHDQTEVEKVGWYRGTLHGRRYLIPTSPLIKAAGWGDLKRQGLINSNLRVNLGGRLWSVKLPTDLEWISIYNAYRKQGLVDSLGDDFGIGGCGQGEWLRMEVNETVAGTAGEHLSLPMELTHQDGKLIQRPIPISDDVPLSTHTDEPYTSESLERIRLDYRPILIQTTHHMEGK